MARRSTPPNQPNNVYTLKRGRACRTRRGAARVSGSLPRYSHCRVRGLQSRRRAADSGWMEPTPRPGDRPLTRQDLPRVVGALAVVFLALALLATGRPILAGFVLGGAVLVGFARMSVGQRRAVGEELLRRERTPLGRVLKVADILAGLVVLYVIAQRLLEWW